MSHIKHQHQPQLRHLSWQTKPNATGWAAGSAFTHIPLSWAIGERVIGGWAPSGPFPEFCWAMEEPARQGEAGTWRLRHQVDTAATWHISKLQLFNLVSVTIAVASEKLGSILCMIVRRRKMDSYFLFYLTHPWKLKETAGIDVAIKSEGLLLSFSLRFFGTHVTWFKKLSAVWLLKERKTTRVWHQDHAFILIQPAQSFFLFFLSFGFNGKKTSEGLRLTDALRVVRSHNTRRCSCVLAWAKWQTHL